MMDIMECNNGEDLIVMDSVVAKAGNVIAVQLGDLEYSQDFGVDKRFFLESDLQFENESFKAYLVQRLTEHQVNVSGVVETIETLFTQFSFQVSGETDTTTGGLIV